MWPLTFAMCVLGFCLSKYGWYKLNKNLNMKDDTLLVKTRREKYKSSNNGEIPTNTISIIVPCYNESQNINTMLLYIEMNCVNKDNVEIIMVDGGSKDNWFDKVKEISHLLTIPYKIIRDKGVTGRGVCQNVGVKESNADIYIFLHADTIVSYGFDQVARRECKDGRCVLGAWKFTVDRCIMRFPLVGLGCMQWAARVRNNNWHLPYGDQGYFIHKDMYQELGGFPDVVICEDFELTSKARKFALATGGRLHVDEMEAFCSPRRWEKNGVAYNTLWNQIAVFCYTQLKYTPEQMYKLYYGYSVPKTK